MKLSELYYVANPVFPHPVYYIPSVMQIQLASGFSTVWMHFNPYFRTQRVAQSSENKSYRNLLESVIKYKVWQRIKLLSVSGKEQRVMSSFEPAAPESCSACSLTPVPPALARLPWWCLI